MVSGSGPALGQLSAGTPTVLRFLRAVVHTVFLVLVAVAAVRLVTVYPVEPTTWIAMGGAFGLAVLYVAGVLVQRWWPNRRWALVWLATVTALWAVLLLHHPDFSWVAFPLFFLHLHLLRGLHALLAVGVITAAVVLAQTWHAQQLSVPVVLGPVLGAVCAVVLAVGYAALYTESEHRRRLIEDLTHTRQELAHSQHTAGVLAERERLAREIHDTLAQGLSSIVLLLRSAERLQSLAEPDAVAEADKETGPLHEVRQAAEDNLAEARRFVRDLTPPDLESDTLAGALERLCGHSGRDVGVQCRFQRVGEPLALGRSHEIALLRAAQSSLANVGAHAQASSVVVTLSFLDTEVTLDIVDDGVGFDPQALVSRGEGGSSGYGLSALRGRIDALGGDLALESTPGAGTAVAVRLPLTEQQEVST